MYFRVQTGTKNKHSFSCLCLLSGALSLILYFSVQTSTETNLILSVYVYRVVLLVATCTSVYKQAPKQTHFCWLCLWGGAFSRNLYCLVQTGTRTNLFLNSLCLLGGAFSLNLYFRVQTGTKPNLFLVFYVYWVVLSVATCTFVYKQAPKQTYLTGGLVDYVFGMVLLVAYKPILQGFSCLCLGGECF